MNGVIYCRVSSKEQIEGTSLESQQAACREYAKSKNITILGAFIEQGESAKFADRTKLLELIEFCREHKGSIEVLLVWKVDRFARNVADHYSVKATLAKYGVRIDSVTEPIDSNPEGRLMETMLAGFAQFDNDIRAMRTVQGMRRKLQEGIFPWRPPLGYQGPAKQGERKTEPDVPDQPLFGLLQKAWKEFATGQYTKADIRRLMEDLGIATRSGKPLGSQSTDNIFRNPFYAGIVADPWSGEEHAGRHAPMVSREEFARVQQIVNRRNRSKPHKKQRAEFPLRGVARCGQCKWYLTAALSGGRSHRYPYYCCHNRRCAVRGRGLRAEVVHEEFEAFLASVAPKRELLGKLGEYLVRLADRSAAAALVQGDRRRSLIAKQNSQLQELISMRAQGLIDDLEFLAQKRTLVQRRNELEAAGTSKSLDPKGAREQLAQIAAPLERLLETWKRCPPAIRHRFEQRVLPLGFVPGEIRTAELGLLFRLPGDFDQWNSNEGSPAYKSSNRIIEEIHELWSVLKEAEGPSGTDP